MAADTRQLLLLEVPAFAGGPARPPKGRRAVRLNPPSLPLQFEARAPAPSPPVVGPRKPKVAAAPPADAVPEDVVFVLPRKLTAGREELVRALVAAVDGQAKGETVVARADGRTLEARLDKGLLRVTVVGSAARAHFLPAVRRVASERGLVEPE